MKLKKKDMCEDIVKITISSGTATNTTFEYEPESQLLKRWVFGNYDAPRGFAKHLRENAEVVTISREAAELLTEYVESIDFARDDWIITEEVQHLMEREDVYFTEYFVASLSEEQEFSYYSLWKDTNIEFNKLFQMFNSIWKEETV